MKKYLRNIIILTGLGLGFTSCGNDDESIDSQNSNQSIVGVWELESLKLNGEIQNMDSCIALGTLEFNATNSYRTYYDFDGVDCFIDEIDTVTYIKLDNKLHVYDSGDTIISEILLLNSNTLELKSEFSVGPYQNIEAKYSR